jgi:glycerophosphoryl diester phosphodiesterase
LFVSRLLASEYDVRVSLVEGPVMIRYFVLPLVITTPVALLAAQPGEDAKALADAARNVRWIIGHRGSLADRPENTMSSYRRGIESGATAIEMDARLTQDGVLVSMHDADVRRTTNGKGLVKDLPFADLRRLDAGSWFDPKYKSEPVPTLREILELCKGKVDLVIDLVEKGEPYAKQVAGEVRQFGDPKRIILGIRQLEHAGQFRKLLPEARQLGLIPTPQSIDAFAEAKVDAIRLWTKWLDDKTLVPQVRRHKVMLHLNGTFGAEDETRMLLHYRPESLASDDPAQLVRSLARIAGMKK